MSEGTSRESRPPLAIRPAGTSRRRLVFGAALVLVLTVAIVAWVERRAIVRSWHVWSFDRASDAERLALAERAARGGAVEHVAAWLEARFRAGEIEKVRRGAADLLVAIGEGQRADRLHLEDLASKDSDRAYEATTWFETLRPASLPVLVEQLRRSADAPESAQDAIATDEIVPLVFGFIDEGVRMFPREAVPALLDLVSAPPPKAGAEYQARVCATLLLASVEDGDMRRVVVTELRRHAESDDANFRSAIARTLDVLVPRPRSPSR